MFHTIIYSASFIQHTYQPLSILGSVLDFGHATGTWEANILEGGLFIFGVK